MKLTNLGWASYLITSKNGTKIITDPFDPTEQHYQQPLKPGLYDETADIITLSHAHLSHCYVWEIKGKPVLYLASCPLEIKDIKLNGVLTYHDEVNGTLRGTNFMICMEVDGVNVCHAGDLGHQLTDAQLKQLGKVDILLLDVFGCPMMDVDVCNIVTEQIKARVVVPIHYWNQPYIPTPPPASGWTPIFNVKDYLVDKKHKWLETNEVEYTPETLPAEMEVILPKPKYDIIV